ncbi:MAG: alpha/beta fold hydrolase [Gammaproteobacteria bacterium]
MMRVILLSCMLVLSGCTHYIFYPMKEQVLTPDAIGVMYEDLLVETNDGLRLHGWKLFSETETTGTLLFFHGNAENISTHFANVYWLVAHGFDVYLFDYRGYGQSQGEAELDPIIDDMDLITGHVIDDLAEDQKLIVMGQSLGASLSIYSVAHSRYRDRIAALVSVAAFSDYHDIAQDALSKSWLFWLFQWPLSQTISNAYSPVESVGKVAPVPIFIMHSKDDEIIDYYHAEVLYEAALEPKQLIILEGGHNATFNLDSNRQKLLDILKSVAVRRTGLWINPIPDTRTTTVLTR